MEDVAVDPRPLPRLVNDLYDAFHGRPCIVVGGGPSAPADYEKARVLENPVVISANGHALNLGLVPDFIWCKDHLHTELKVPMRDLLHGLGAPIVSRQHWADFRAPLWPVSGNSGQMALGLGVFLGCAPVVPLGFDAFQAGTYFHAPNRPNVSLGRPLGYWQARYKRMASIIGTQAVRPVSGPLRMAFPTFGQPAEPYIPPTFAALRPGETVLVRTVTEATDPYDRRANVPAGTVLALHPNEVARWRGLTGAVNL